MFEAVLQPLYEIFLRFTAKTFRRLHASKSGIGSNTSNSSSVICESPGFCPHPRLGFQPTKTYISSGGLSGKLGSIIITTATITVHALCYMAVLDGSTVTIAGVLYSAIAMADRAFDPRVSLMSIPQGSGTQRGLHVGSHCQS